MPGKTHRFIVMVLIVSHVLFAQDKPSIVWHQVNEGEWTRLYLKNSPFPHPSRQSGHTYKNLRFTYAVNYSDSSAIVFLPKGYKTLNEQNDLIVHFHGWNNEVLNVMHNFNMLPQLYNSHKNAILILAQGPKNAMDSAGGKIEERNGLKRFIQEILNILKDDKKIANNKIGQIIISAHNGGYRPAILGLVNGGLEKNVKELFLFNAFYDLTDLIIPWLKMDKDHRLRSIYTESLAPEHREFLKLLYENGLRYNNVLKPDTKIMLQFSRACEDCLIENNFEKWLKNSPLEDIEN